jgi:flagellar hook assembly protein FlgD
MAGTISSSTKLPVASAMDIARLLKKKSSTFKADNSESSQEPASSGTKDLSKDMFLKLMVAQLKYQNPLNPIDGTDFLQQLSQISGVEQMVEMRKELTAIHELLAMSSTDAA